LSPLFAKIYEDEEINFANEALSFIYRKLLGGQVTSKKDWMKGIDFKDNF